MESVERGWSKRRGAANERHGVEAGIERVYREQLDAFLRVAAAIVGDRERAVDVVHEGFARALAHAGQFRGDGPLEGWVWRAVVNEARRARAEYGRAAVDPAPRPAPASSGDGSARLRLAITSLPDRQRLAVFLRYYADLDYVAIAVAMEVAPGTAAATLSQAHANLRQILEEATGGA
jgi:RNA polymerase sigma-70 factor, ECF subfamily